MKFSSRPAAGTFAPALRDAIASRDVTLVWLRDRLADTGNPVSLSTLSYWRSGRRNPEGAASRAAIAEIERLLDLDEGELDARIGPHRRVGPVAPAVPPFEASTLNEAVDETRAALQAPFGVSRELATHVVADIDADGVLRRRWIRTVVQVTSGTVSEYPWVEVVEGDDGPPVFTDALGARLSRTHDHPSGMAYGVVLELDRPVPAPGSAVLEWVTEYPHDVAPTLECMHGRTRDGGAMLVWVRFHPDRLPVWVEEFTEDGETPPLRVPFSSGTTAHTFLRSFGPGVFGLRWAFD